eukprot:598195-Hanusia_phi.AAC.1
MISDSEAAACDTQARRPELTQAEPRSHRAARPGPGKVEGPAPAAWQIRVRLTEYPGARQSIEA